MHKSGTTLISQILHKSGINMGSFDEDISYDQGNQFERLETQKINMQILDCFEVHSLDVLHPCYSIPGDSHVTKQIQNLVDQFNNNLKIWGFKDPRTCLTYHIWKKYLPEHRLICVFRHPQEVFFHYIKNIPDRHIYLKIKLGFKSLKAWYLYNNELLTIAQIKSSDIICIDFNRLVSSNEYIYKLNKFVGFDLVDCRATNLYRAKQKKSFLYFIIKNVLAKIKLYNINEMYNSLLSRSML